MSWLRISGAGDLDTLLAELNGRTSAAEIADGPAARALGLDGDQVCSILRSLFYKGLLKHSDDECAGQRAGLSSTALTRHSRDLHLYSMFEQSKISRYERLARLRDARLTIIGAGGVGSWFAVLAACHGIGSLRLVDDDVVEESNLARQIVFTTADLGQPKVEVLRKALLRFNPDIEVLADRFRIASVDDARRCVTNSEFVVQAGDSPPRLLSRWVNEACAVVGVPSIYMSGALKSITVGPLVVPGETSCYECGWLWRWDRDGMRELEALGRAEKFTSVPTPALSIIPAWIASLLSWEMVCHISGLSVPSSRGRLLRLDTQAYDFRTFDLQVHPLCPHCARANRPGRVQRAAPSQSEEQPARAEAESRPRASSALELTLATVRWRPRVWYAVDSVGTVQLTDLEGHRFQIRRVSQAFVALCEALMSPTRVSDLQAEIRSRFAEADAEQVPVHVVALIRKGLVEAVHPMPEGLLSTQELTRYDRQLRYFGAFETEDLNRYQIQALLRRSQVALIGVGGVGNWVAQHLSCVGVGALVLVDCDNVELSNLNRQFLYRPEDVGRIKTDVAVERLRSAGGPTRIVAMQKQVTSVQDVEEVLADSDIGVLTADKPPVQIRRWVSEASAHQRVPVIQGSVDAYLGQIGPLYKPPETGCYGCREAAMYERYGNDYELRVSGHLGHSGEEPPLTAALCAFVGTSVAADVIRYLGGFGPASTVGRYQLVDARTWKSHAVPIEDRDDCPTCGLM